MQSQAHPARACSVSNQEWDGGPVRARDFMRLPQHERYANSQLDIVYNGWGCMCFECMETKRCYIDPDAPEIEELAQYSYLALTWSASLVYHDDVEHDARPPLNEWLATLRDAHSRARRTSADQDDLEHLHAERSKSRRPPQRWLGRSPGYYSRGR